MPRLLADIRENATSWPVQLRQWARSALHYAEEVSRLGTNSDPSFRSLFWIRAYAALTDIRDEFEGKAEILAEVNQHPGGPAGPAWAVLTRHVLESIDAVRGELSEDDLVYFWYRRQVEVHPFQDAVRLRVLKKTGAVSDRRRVDLLGRECCVEKLNGAIRRVLLRYGRADPQHSYRGAAKIRECRDEHGSRQSGTVDRWPRTLRPAISSCPGHPGHICLKVPFSRHSSCAPGRSRARVLLLGRRRRVGGRRRWLPFRELQGSARGTHT